MFTGHHSGQSAAVPRWHALCVPGQCPFDDSGRGSPEVALRLMNMLNRVTDVGFVVATILGIVTLVGVIGAVWFLLVS